jgi:hypothetical protein
MRNLGLICLFGGLLAFFYCTTQLSGLDPVPAGLSLRQHLDYQAGRFELGRYAALCVAGIGLLLSLFPRGR